MLCSSVYLDLFGKERQHLNILVQGVPYAPHSEEGVSSSQLDSNTDTSTDGGATASGTTALEDHDAEALQAAQQPRSRESTPISVPFPQSILRFDARQQDSYQETQFDSTQESQVSQENESTIERNRMNLSAADIERWIDGSGPIHAVPRIPSAPNLLGEGGSHSLPTSRFSALHNGSKPSRASWTIAKSTSRFGAEKLLRSSIQVLYELENAMLSYEYLLIVQVAGVAGVCRALVKSLTKLVDKCASSTSCEKHNVPFRIDAPPVRVLPYLSVKTAVCFRCKMLPEPTTAAYFIPDVTTLPGFRGCLCDSAFRDMPMFLWCGC